MSDAAYDDLAAIVPPLLHGLGALEWIARYFNPADLRAVIGAVGTPDAPLRDVLPRAANLAEPLAEVRTILDTAGAGVLAAFDGLRESVAQDGDPRLARRALRSLPQAQEALYGLAAALPPVSAYFLEPGMRDDEALRMRLSEMAGREGVGIFQSGTEPKARGGFSLYVPEYYTPDTAWPLVVALHGGGGNGDAFLWSWLRAARSRGAILVAPTAIGSTWALSGPDPDSANLVRILELVRSRWHVDPSRLLLTGMSDGGTFSFASGLEPGSPFTHLAPVATSFPAMLAEMADPDRIRGLPIHLVHGALDWMFPVERAREARLALANAGAVVTYREVADLSHCYPQEMNGDILAWLGATRRIT